MAYSVIRSFVVGLKRRPKRLLTVYYVTCAGVLTWAYSESSALHRRRMTGTENLSNKEDCKTCPAQTPRTATDDINLLSVNL